jgi:two-component system, cell cycle sensor histidine kinase and response regulator CckA
LGGVFFETKTTQSLQEASMTLEIQSPVFFRCVEDSSEAIMITDADGTLEYVNPAWSTLYGFSAQEALGAKPSLLHSGKQGSEFYEEMWTQIRDPHVGVWKGEILNKTRDGRFIFVFLSITPYRDAKGSVAGYMGIAIDISEKKETERRMQEEDRLFSVGLLACGAVHEIGTLVTIVKGRAEQLYVQADPASASIKVLKLIVEQMDRVAHLVQSLMNLARDPGENVLAEVSLLPILNSVLSLLSVQLRSSNVSVTFENEPGLTVYSDANRLIQVFLNIIVNAIHALEECKTAKLNECALWQPEIKIVLAAVGRDFVEIKIADNGLGIAAEVVQKIFTPFFTTKKRGAGTGLGLAVVSQILGDLRGEIRVESTLAVGTEFVIHLPCKTNSA